MSQRTPLYDEHVRLGARMVEFAGWEMPVQYSNLIEEHIATRTNAGLFDISHMGEFIVKGPQAKDLLQRCITNNLDSLPVGKAFYSVMCNPNGGVIDDLFVYNFSGDTFMVVVNAGNIQKDFGWLQKQAETFDATVKDVSADMVKIDLQGPKAASILKKVCDVDFPERFHFKDVKIGRLDVILSRTGYTGEDGFELYYHRDSALDIWNSVMEAGKPDGLLPVGLGARDTLRIESCYSLYGHELTDEISPLEAGVGFVVKLDKDFIGKGPLEKQKADGPKRKLIAFEMDGRGVARESYPVLARGKTIGSVTSGTFAPTLQKPVGMALVETAAVKLGDAIEIEVRQKKHGAKVVKRPFREFQGGASQ